MHFRTAGSRAIRFAPDPAPQAGANWSHRFNSLQRCTRETPCADVKAPPSGPGANLALRQIPKDATPPGAENPALGRILGNSAEIDEMTPCLRPDTAAQ